MDGTNFYFIASSDGRTDNGTHGFMQVAHGMSAGNWYHIAVIFDASQGEAEMFLNGSSLGTGTEPFALPTSIFNGTALFSVGSQNGADVYLDGVLDEMGLWSIDNDNRVKISE